MEIGAVRMERNGVLGWDETNAAISALEQMPPHVMQKLRQENRCFYCRKTGHIASDCQQKAADPGQQGKEKDQSDQRRRRSEN